MDHACLHSCGAVPPEHLEEARLPACLKAREAHRVADFSVFNAVCIAQSSGDQLMEKGSFLGDVPGVDDIAYRLSETAVAADSLVQLDQPVCPLVKVTLHPMGFECLECLGFLPGKGNVHPLDGAGAQRDRFGEPVPFIATCNQIQSERLLRE